MNSKGLIQFINSDKLISSTTNAKSIVDKYILVVEDLEINMKVITSFLKLMGYPYVIAYNGYQALEVLCINTIDLIFMDIQMPLLNGFEATAIIRQRDAINGRHTTIIAMTAFGTIGDKELCLKAGMDDYISKPLDFNKLEELLIRYL